MYRLVTRLLLQDASRASFVRKAEGLKKFKVHISMFSCSKNENVSLLGSANDFKKTPSMTDLHAYVVIKLLKCLLNLNNMASG